MLVNQRVPSKILKSTNCIQLLDSGCNCTELHIALCCPTLRYREALAFPRLDILINNAAQTVRRPAAHYAQLLQGEMLVLEERLAPWIWQFGNASKELTPRVRLCET